MSRQTNLFAFLKRKEPEPSTTTTNEEVMLESSTPVMPESTPVIEQNTFETHKSETEETQDLLLSLERDPGLRVPMWDWPYEKRDQIRRAYLKLKPYQPILKRFPFSGPDSHRRRFQASWYKKFPDWLEYSTSKDAAFCLLCYLFADKPNRNTQTFTLVGFNNWKKVNDGDNCPLITHVGGGPCSAHNNSVRAKLDLLNDRGHIRHALISQGEEQIKRNRIRLMTSIDVVRLLTLQSCPLRGHNESENPENRGNFLEFRKAFARYNDDVSRAIENNDYNAKYVAPSIQKEILQIISAKVRNHIREEIGESKFFIIVDEARDEAMKEQMAIVLRFVDKNGSIKERFLQLVRVNDTRWISHLQSINSLLNMFDATILVLERIMVDKSCTSSQRGDADVAINLMISYEFVFILLNKIFDS